MKKSLVSAAMIALMLGSVFAVSAQKVQQAPEQPADTTEVPAPEQPADTTKTPAPAESEKSILLSIVQAPEQPAEPGDSTQKDEPQKEDPKKDEPQKDEPAPADKPDGQTLTAPYIF